MATPRARLRAPRPPPTAPPSSTGCTACNFASAGCPSKAPNGNASYPTTYPYLEQQYGTATANQAKGGALHQLPAIQAQFVATGAPGSVQNQLHH